MERHLPARAGLQPPGTGDVAELPRLPQRLLASWQRSQDYGVSLESIQPVFTGSLDEGSLYFQCGNEVLSNLSRTLAADPISMMLTDADGLVLNRFSGDHSLLRALDSVHLAPGFSYSEREAGTNGLGLALADRAPTVVRAEEHYALSLCTYTCAAVPVLDPISGYLAGAVNLTTWSKDSTGLLLALAQSAASNTAALMLARASGHQPRPTPRGAVFRVEQPQLEPGSGTLPDLGGVWSSALIRAREALDSGRVVAAVGEPGSGRATLLAQAERAHAPSSRILAASTPVAEDTEAWLDLWVPEVGKPHSAVIVRHVDDLPLWAAESLRDLIVERSRSSDLAITFTAERFEDIPTPLATLVDTVVHVPPLRERDDDVVQLARHIALRLRGREIEFTPQALRALENHPWPGNVGELAQVVRRAASHTDCVDVHHLPSSVLSGTTRRLSRIEAFERDEILRVLTSGEINMRQAAERLGMSRATLYRKLTQYNIHIPH